MRQRIVGSRLETEAHSIAKKSFSNRTNNPSESADILQNLQLSRIPKQKSRLPDHKLPQISLTHRHQESSQLTLPRPSQIKQLGLLKGNPATERPAAQGFTDNSNDYDNLKEELEKLRNRLGTLRKETAEVDNRLNRARKVLPPMPASEYAKLKEDGALRLYESSLKAIEQKNINLANKIVQTQDQMKKQRRIINHYCKAISRYEDKFEMLKEEEKFRLVKQALKSKELGRFVKGKSVFRKYLDESLSSLEF